jgi:hypothetical protein
VPVKKYRKNASDVVMYIPMSPRILLNIIKPIPSGSGMIVITGMPKSGTTAIAKLLGEATEKRVSSDPFYRLSQMKVDFRDRLFSNQLSLKTLWRRYRHVFSGTIIKDPNFVSLLPQIREMLPEAGIVFIIRDPRDNIRSILNRLGLPGRPQECVLDLAELPIGWRNLLSGRSPDVSGSDYIEILAKRWRMAAETLQLFQEYCAVIRYEDFRSNKCDAIYNLARQLGYVDLTNIEDHVDIQYQPKGDSTVLWDKFFGNEQLAVIEAVTTPLLQKYGYAKYTAGQQAS